MDKSDLSATPDLIVMARQLRDLATQLVGRLEGRVADTPPPAPVLADPPLDGRWTGEMPNRAFALRLRLDRDVSGRISGDIAAASPYGFEWIYSFATTPGEQVFHGASSWPVWLEAGGRHAGEGHLAIAWVSAEEIVASFGCSGAPPGLPADTALYFPMRRDSEHVRSVRLRTTLAAPQAKDTLALEPVTATFMEKLAEAGIGVLVESGERLSDDTVGGRGWGQVELADSVLRRGLSRLSSAAVPPDLDFDLVVASNSARGGLLSFSLDPGAALGRRIVSVFADGADDPTGVRQALHQFGAMCGLLPHWDPRINGLSPASPMARASGAVAAEIAAGACGNFDPRELSYLRHAGISALHEGLRGAVGAYWTEGFDQPPPPTYTAPPQNLILEVELPLNGAVIELGQPLFLTVRLKNIGIEPVLVGRELLDAKLEHIKVELLREGWLPVQASPRRFLPSLRRRTQQEQTRLAPGTHIESNLQIFYGRDGIALADSGTYVVFVHLDIPTGEGTARIDAMPIRVRIRAPSTREAEREAMQLLVPSTGLFLALGGIQFLDNVADGLQKIAADREGRGERNGVLATIRRVLAIDAGRAYPGMSAREREQRLETAVNLMEGFDEALLSSFDPRTRADFCALMEAQRARLASLGGPPSTAKAAPAGTVRRRPKKR